MIQRICATLFIAILYLLFAVQGVPRGVSLDAPSIETGISLKGKTPSSEDAMIAKTPIDSHHSAGEIPLPVSSLAASYSESDQSWTLFAKVVQLRDASIYGKPGTIAQVEYLRDGQPEYAWTVIRIDDYYFGEELGAITEGQEIMLEVSGDDVSHQGVNWDACTHDDLYCEYAGFIEGGFPISEDYNGLTVCPSNVLIYSGYAPDDWINGMLAWKILLSED
jgi:hypothetical protein